MTARSLTLTALNGPAAGQRWEVREGAPVRFGATRVCDVVVPGDATMAPAHFAVRWDASGPRVRALESRFGLWLEGAAVEGEAPLADGLRLCAGSTWFVVAMARAEPAAEAAPTDPREAALAALRADAGRLYAVLDAARADRVRELVRRTNYRRACLYDGWGERVFGEAAPWLVHVWKRGRLVEQLVDEGMGKGWGVFLASRRPFAEVRRQCRRLLLAKVEGEKRRMLFRWYDPGVLLAVYPHMAREALHGRDGVIDAFMVESREGDRIVTLR